MAKFLRGFRASLFNSKKHRDADDVTTSDSVCGAYRVHTDEFYSNVFEYNNSPLRPTKSTSNLTEDIPVTLRKSTQVVSMNPRGSDIENKRNSRQDKEKRPNQKLVEAKKRLEQEERKTFKKINEVASENQKRNKAPPIPPPMSNDNAYSNPLAKKINKTNSNQEISLKATGPAPYEAVPDKLKVIPNKRDNSGNTSFGEPVESSSWDMVTQHREQMAKPAAPERRLKKTVLDLNFNIDGSTTNGYRNEEDA